MAQQAQFTLIIYWGATAWQTVRGVFAQVCITIYLLFIYYLFSSG